MAIQYRECSVISPDDLIYGRALKPLTLANGMVIGGGTVYPEINFSLPPMEITNDSMPEVRRQYKEMISGVLARGKGLNVSGLVVEVELLPPTTVNPKWGLEITKVVRETMAEYEGKFGLKSVMRITPNDVRDMVRPPRMAGGQMWDAMVETFRQCALAGAELLAIESTGGKEVHDDALLMCDLQSVIFSLGVMGVRDMTRLWGTIVDIARETGAVPAGDTACGFGNTAMVLAENGYVPRVFAAVVRVITVVRSLVAYEMGALGPSKDCAYEGPYIKAITGLPISMEGKAAACAHLSPLGNISAAVADLWSNESVQNVKLLGGMAPTVSLEQLTYDCRLLNTAGKDGLDGARRLRDWMVESDSYLDPQAYVLRPDVVVAISRQIVTEENHYRRAKLAAQLAIEAMRDGVARGRVRVAEREKPWLDRMLDEVESLPDTEEAAWDLVKGRIDRSKVVVEDYGLAF